MQVSRNKVVTIEYTLTDPGGEVLDTSRGSEPLSYVHGVGSLVPGLESALEGKSAPDRVEVTVSPEEGYGEHDDELVLVQPRSLFDSAGKVEVGMQFEMQTDEGAHIVTVTALDGENVTVDANHPLAGMTLHFDVSIVSVRDATAEEIEHGHAHDGHGHDGHGHDGHDH
jgi:FKBP-type peptidyl-prolyl cis-trans isomerase SlyD